MTTGQKIYECRKKYGMTQEDLAEKLSVSRQAVSKWESDAAFPETEKILELCRLFDLSGDELFFGKDKEDYCGDKEAQPSETERFHYEYVSQTRVFGLPLVHINFGLGAYKAKGIFAIGNIATGLFSFGFISFGIISCGLFALGLLLSLGTIAVALGVGAGAVAAGALAFGGVSIGVMTFGGVSIGYLSVGGAAIGQYALGGYANGWLAVGNSVAIGQNAFVVPEQLSQLNEFIDENITNSWLSGFIKGIARNL